MIESRHQVTTDRHCFCEFLLLELTNVTFKIPYPHVHRDIWLEKTSKSRNARSYSLEHAHISVTWKTTQT